MSITSWIKNSMSEDRHNQILWLPVIFACGIIFYFYLPQSSASFATAILLFSLPIHFLIKKSLCALIVTIFCSGFLWTKIYTEKIINTKVIDHKFYATAIANIDDLTSYYNPITKRTAYRITLKNISLYKAGTIKNDTVIKKNKIKKIKNKAKKSPPKPHKKPLNKTMIKNYLNVAGYQDIDREFLAPSYQFHQNEWTNNRYIHPPEKIVITTNTKINDAKINDLIQTRVLLEPLQKNSFLDRNTFDNYFKHIGAKGYAASDLKILSSNNPADFGSFFKILRQKIAQKILDQSDKRSAGVAVALLIGSQNFIAYDVKKSIRSAGLAHIIAISGLHFGLAAGIFFFSLRLVLSFNQYLTLNYDIKKIAAFIAIIASFGYLLLSGSPIPALRSFIMISLVFISIIFDLRLNSLRSVMVAALLILIFSPNVIFSVSFQLSFAAILSLIAFYEYSKKFSSNSLKRPLYLKFFSYFLAIIFSSIVASLATTPLSIYHFNNYVSYGILANLIVIPIMSFITMPCGFLAILLMPFSLEKIALHPMSMSIDLIIRIAQFCAQLPHSFIVVKSISAASLGFITVGGLWLFLWQQSWRLLGLLPITFGTYLAYQTPIPNLIIMDKLFALYDDDKLILSRLNKTTEKWVKKAGQTQFIIIDDANEEERSKLHFDNNKDYKSLILKNKSILILSGRNKIKNLCDKNYDLVINTSKKYQIPNCIKSKIIIDNQDLLDKGYFFYFDDGIRFEAISKVN